MRFPELDAAAGNVRGGENLTARLGATFPTWIAAVDASQLPGLTNFALRSAPARRRQVRQPAGCRAPTSW